MISQSIRRRFFGVSGADYVFSASTTSKNVSWESGSFNISITSTKNDSTIGFEVYGYDGCVTGVTISSTNITVSYSENTTDLSREGTVILKQTDSGNMITINITQYEPSYVFECSGGTVNYNETSEEIYINSTYGSRYVNYSIVSYSGFITSATVTSSSYFTIGCDQNSTVYNREGTVVLKQAETDEVITVELTQEAYPVSFEANAIVIDGDNGSSGSITLNVMESGSVYTKPDWVNITCSNGVLSVVSTSTNGDTARYGEATIIVGSQTKPLYLIQMPSSYNSIDGHDYVEMAGGLKWAIKNIGANGVSETGNYYMYGKGNQVYNSSDSAYTGKEATLSLSNDTARQVMGGGWRMPKKSEADALFNGLFNRYKFTSSTYNGVKGAAFYDQWKNSCIFFPYAGYMNRGNLVGFSREGWYWTATSDSSYNDYAAAIVANSSHTISQNQRYLGYQIRGIHD